MRLALLSPALVPWNFVTPLLVILLAVVTGLLWRQFRLLRQLVRQATLLRASEERLRYVIEGSEDGFWDWDVTRDHMERSDRWAAMLGYQLGEIPATLAGGTSLVHPDDLPGYEAWRQRVLDGAVDRFGIEYRMRAKSGEWRWILDRGKVVARDANGRPLRLAGTHSDISGRKLTEAALLESQALYKRSTQLLDQAQQAARVGGWETDLRTGRVYWTKEAYRINETTPEEFVPTREAAFSSYTPESRQMLVAATARAVQTGEPYSLELEMFTAKGRLLSVHTVGVPEMENGRAVKLYGSFRDITAEKAAARERENLQLKMLEAQKLESLGVLAGGIAHDFNNLLTVILANAALLHSDVQEAPPLRHIENAARRAADLCRQMLAYAGKGRFVVERVDLGVLVKETSDLIRISVSKKARLDFDLAPGLPPVAADSSQLRQVAMNLVFNASEALGDRSGTIRISTRLGRPDPATAPGVLHSFNLPPGDCVCLEISDTGEGMSPATLERIFDPFFTTKFTGRGLGLAAVLGIVRTHRGALAVESTPGRGSTFRLHLPVAPPGPPAAAPAPAVTPAPSAGRGTLLVADDEPAVLETVQALLRQAGYRTSLAADGHQAVEQFRVNPAGFDAVLLDLTMPGLDGAETARIIRSLNPATPILVMSGFGEEEVLARLHGIGPVAFLHKPFTREALLSRIADVLPA